MTLQGWEHYGSKAVYFITDKIFLKRRILGEYVPFHLSKWYEVKSHHKTSLCKRDNFLTRQFHQMCTFVHIILMTWTRLYCYWQCNDQNQYGVYNKYIKWSRISNNYKNQITVIIPIEHFGAVFMNNASDLLKYEVLIKKTCKGILSCLWFK